VFPVKYKLNLYILRRRDSVFKELNIESYPASNGIGKVMNGEYVRI
jgi:hypothetical protein